MSVTSTEGAEAAPEERSRSGWGGVLARWWVTVGGLAMVIGSDYRFRARDPLKGLGGGVDAAVALELALYAVVGALVALTYWKVPRVRRIPLPLLLLVSFAGMVMLSVAYTPYRQYAAVRATQGLVLLAFTGLVAFRATRADLHRFAHAFLALVMGSVIYGVVRPSVPVNRLQEGRFTWLAIHPTVSGLILAIGVVLATSYVVFDTRPRPGPRWNPILYMAGLALSVTGLYGTETRGAVAGAFVALVVLGLSSRRGLAALDVVAGLVLLALGGALALRDQVLAYFARGENTESLTTLNSRTDLWDLALEQVRTQPMYGHGLSASRGLFYSDIGLGGGHNAVVNVLVEQGLVGLALWAGAVIATFVWLRRLPRDGAAGMVADRAMLLALLTLLMVDGIFYEGTATFANVGATWFFVIVAWTVVASRDAGLLRR